MKDNHLISVLIVDDYQMSSLGTKAMLMPDDSIVIAGLAKNGIVALEMLATLKVDIVLLDILMPEMDGFETLAIIKQKYPKVKVIMITGDEDRDTIARVISMKAEGFVFKDVMLDELIKAVHKVYEGDYHYNMRVFDVILSGMMNNSGNQGGSSNQSNSTGNKQNSSNESEKDSIKSKLTNREFEVLCMVGKGMSTKEISETLNISKFTVSTYRKNLYSKLKVENLTSLMGIAKNYISAY